MRTTNGAFVFSLFRKNCFFFCSYHFPQKSKNREFFAKIFRNKKINMNRSCLKNRTKTPKFMKTSEILELFVLVLFLVCFAGAISSNVFFFLIFFQWPPLIFFRSRFVPANLLNVYSRFYSTTKTSEFTKSFSRSF